MSSSGYKPQSHPTTYQFQAFLIHLDDLFNALFVNGYAVKCEESSLTILILFLKHIYLYKMLIMAHRSSPVSQTDSYWRL